jgi:DNA repair exonuclease SbcCD ATPase subunit
LINLLWRDQREVMEQLFELSGELLDAQAQASGDALRSLMAQRRELEAALLRRAQALAKQAGMTVSDAMLREAQETLGAAMADAEVAAEVRSGRLIKPASYAGFGFGVVPGAAAAPPRHDRTAKVTPLPTRRQPPEPSGEDAAKREAALRVEAERREAAQRRLQQARAALNEAVQTLAERTRAATAAQDQLEQVRLRGRELEERHQALQAELRAVEDQLRETRARVIETEAGAEAAVRLRQVAEREHSTARQAVQEAESAAAG